MKYYYHNLICFDILIYPCYNKNSLAIMTFSLILFLLFVQHNGYRIY
jgi:hypothetical protein